MTMLPERIGAGLSRFGLPSALLFARIAIAHVFWASGRTKVEGLRLREEAVDLFRYEYSLPLISPETAALVAAMAEHLLPVLLVVGLATRVAAAGLAFMTMIIQLFVYPDAWWTHHALWLAILLTIVTAGPGLLSADALLVRWRRR